MIQFLVNCFAIYSLAGASVIYGPGASPGVTNLAGYGVSGTAPTNAYVLTWNSTTSAWEPAAAAASGMTNPMNASGDIIYGGASGTPTRLAKGSDGTVLTLASGIPSWAAASSQWVTSGSDIYYSAGKVLVGAPASVDASAAPFKVGGAAIDNYIASFNSTSGTGSGLVFVAHAAATGTDFQGVTAVTLASAQAVVFNPSGGQVAIGSADGTMTYTGSGAGAMATDAGGVVTTTSDERLKDIKGSFERGIEDLKVIEPIIYSWKGVVNGKKSPHDPSYVYAGFSAQNLEKGIPEAVTENSDGYLSVQDRPVIAALVNAVKELNARLEKLEGPSFHAKSIAPHGPRQKSPKVIKPCSFATGRMVCKK